MCNILKTLEEHVDKLENDFKTIMTKNSNKTIGSTEDGYDVYNETYTERVRLSPASEEETLIRTLILC